MVSVQSFIGGAAGHRWGCWSQVGLLVTGGAAGHRRGCWSQVGLLVLVPGAGVTALVPVLVLVTGFGADAALVLVSSADGARRVGRVADGLQVGRDLTVGGAQALELSSHSAATLFPLFLSPLQHSAATPFPLSFSPP
ncbi:unnamed protein product [Closterium sp. Naga37s-1]|nr:unnamed protein product [Closterium sp. Naga37s-1]